MFLPLLPLTGAANIAIGGDAANNGVIYGFHFIAVGLALFFAGQPWEVAAIVACVVTAVYAAWRSPSPRRAELDLLWENPDPSSTDLGRKTTKAEIRRTLLRHGLALLLIAAACAFHSLWALALPLLALVPVLSHLAAWNKTRLGRWLAAKDSGYPRRFGELISGIFMHGIALAVLAEAVLYFIANLMK